MDVDNTSSAKFPCKNVEKVAESQVESNVNIIWGKLEGNATFLYQGDRDP